MKSVYSLFFLSSFYFYTLLTFAQQENKKTKGYIVIGIEGGFRGSISRHTTPYMKYDQLHGNWSGKNDRVGIAPLGSFIGFIGYRFADYPLSISITGGMQAHQTKNFPGYFKYDNKFKPIKSTFYTRNLGAQFQYAFFQDNKGHEIGSLAGFGFLFNAFNLNSTLNPDFLGVSQLKEGNEYLDYVYNSDYILTNLSFGLNVDLGFYYRYYVKERLFLSSSFSYQVGIRPIAGTGVVFLESSDPKYANKTSYSSSNGDGFTINVGIGYRLPIKGSSKRS